MPSSFPSHQDGNKIINYNYVYQDTKTVARKQRNCILSESASKLDLCFNQDALMPLVHSSRKKKEKKIAIGFQKREREDARRKHYLTTTPNHVVNNS